MTQCPTCNVPLRFVVECNVDIDVCDACHGVWLDPGELDSLSNSSGFTPREFSADELFDLKCPRCSTREFASVRTELGAFARCSRCGGVFVGGETLDCIAKCDRSLLPSKQAAESVVMSADAIGGLLDLLWLFVHH